MYVLTKNEEIQTLSFGTIIKPVPRKVNHCLVHNSKIFQKIFPKRRFFRKNAETCCFGGGSSTMFEQITVKILSGRFFAGTASGQNRLGSFFCGAVMAAPPCTIVSRSYYIGKWEEIQMVLFYSPSISPCAYTIFIVCGTVSNYRQNITFLVERAAADQERTASRRCGRALVKNENDTWDAEAEGEEFCPDRDPQKRKNPENPPFFAEFDSSQFDTFCRGTDT